VNSRRKFFYSSFSSPRTFSKSKNSSSFFFLLQSYSSFSFSVFVYFLFLVVFFVPFYLRSIFLPMRENKKANIIPGLFIIIIFVLGKKIIECLSRENKKLSN